MKRSMPTAAASSRKVMVAGGTAEISEMYTLVYLPRLRLWQLLHLGVDFS